MTSSGTNPASDVPTLPGRYGPEAEFLERAERAGVAVRGLSSYGMGGGGGCGGGDEGGDGDGAVRLVLGYAHLSVADIGYGVGLLAGSAGR
ncbi:hypothetical protein [Streptomyces sp. NPDC051561]|uniref:hypothetical protein n=1 Tax=Streptomyces sp. NPDC051561 TaxID=3365658 RepID=UPI0037B4D0EC